MGRYDYYKPGDWNAECDVCGQKYKASKLKLRWDGLRVCPKDFEYRNPQDFVRGIKDNQSTPFSRPEPPDIFAVFNYTQYPNEQVPTSDFAFFSFVKQIGKLFDATPLNGSALNLYAVNGSSLPAGDESISLAESHSINAGKNISETFSVSETTTISLVSSSSLDGAALNLFAIG